MKMLVSMTAAAFFYMIALCCGCSDSSTGPEPGGEIIAYCYQPLQDGIHQIYSINIDGSENRKMIESTTGLNHHDWSPNGQQMACVGYMGSDFSTWSIHVFNVDGTNLTRLTNEADVWDTEPVWPPDGSEIAFTRMYPDQSDRSELWIMDSDGGNPHYIGVEGFAAKWSSDGTRFVYSARSSGNYEIFTCRTDGTDLHQLTSTEIDEFFPTWSPDDSLIAYNAYPSGDYDSSEIYIMDADGENVTRLTANDVSDGYPRFSPDGSRISFTRDLSSQQWEIFVMNIDGTDVRRVTNSPSGITAINAVWKPSS
jgi:TolB protein